MIEFYIIFLVSSLFVFGVIKIYGFLTNDKTKPLIKLEELTVVIPVRNESNHLNRLFSSILAQNNRPEEIIFVNDHSTDQSVELINSFIQENNIGKLIELNSKVFGKKEAIALAIQESKSRFVLTLDADVYFSQHYFYTLEYLPQNTLIGLPVVMKGNTFLSKIFSVEYNFFNGFNYWISKVHPISISGANLLFDTTKVNYAQQLEHHKSIASGDDYFLLKEVKKNIADVYFSQQDSLSVYTDSPKSIKDYVAQRVRWLSKTKSQLNIPEFIIGIFILVYLLGGICALFISVTNGQWGLLLAILILRFLFDTIITLNYRTIKASRTTLLLLPFFQLIYPFLFLLVTISSFIYQPKWKGRKV
ncbi:glycosyltransferase [Brumimicrobium aurantiacum]|uniref:Glycosyltransferase n=1 Tax=Brumimicrobium aurantiacum TaxID=1737063 RepID=A0A3E1EYA2_9FLAO|nr:glycosyltransferase [Brumimicrobium aurantiacum]RFC54540.1 glycosyltransferase [Brumimicrobium aurantiacum]